jgi:hypothetical protein
MGYPTDNPMDGRGGEVAAGRAAMPEDPGPITASASTSWALALPRLVQFAANADGATSKTHTARAWIELRGMAEVADWGRAALAALRLALPELREDLEALVEGNTVGTPAYAAHQPLPADLDPEVLMCATDKKAAHDAVVAAISAAEGR